MLRFEEDQQDIDRLFCFDLFRDLVHEHLGRMAEAFAVPWEVQSVGARGAESRRLRVEDIGPMEQSTGE